MRRNYFATLVNQHLDANSHEYHDLCELRVRGFGNSIASPLITFFLALWSRFMYHGCGGGGISVICTTEGLVTGPEDGPMKAASYSSVTIPISDSERNVIANGQLGVWLVEIPSGAISGWLTLNIATLVRRLCYHLCRPW